MSPPRRNGLVTAVVIIGFAASCELVDSQPVVAADAGWIAGESIAVSGDHSRIWTISATILGPPSTVAHDSSTGAEVVSRTPSPLTPIDLAPAPGSQNGSAAWLLYSNGSRLRLDETGQVTATRGVVAGAIPSPQICRGFAVGPDDAHYLLATVSEGGTSQTYVYRQAPIALTWTRRWVSSSTVASDIAFDPLANDVVVADYSGSNQTIVRAFAPDTLIPTYTQALGMSGVGVDFASFGHNLAIADGTSVLLFDPAGTLTDIGGPTDGVTLANAVAFDLTPQTTLRLWWANAVSPFDPSPPEHAVGWFNVVEG